MERKLIEAVRVRKVLYDISHEDYLKTKLKAEKWEEVAKETDIRSGAEAKVMWEKLRHSLRDALRRQQKYMKSGAPAGSFKQWRFQKQMAFLQPFMTTKALEGNLWEYTDDSETPSQNCDIYSPTDVIEEREESLNIQQGIGSARDEAESQALPEISAPACSKTMEKDTIAGFVEKHEERKKSRSGEKKRMLERTSVPSDPLYHFFISMYEVTKNMPPSSQFVVKNDIFRVVTEMEATLLNVPAGTSKSNTVQRPSHHELSPYGNPKVSQSYTSLSTPTHSSHSDSPFPNPEENAAASKEGPHPLEPTVVIKEEPVEFEPTPSTSADPDCQIKEEFILPHEENAWTAADSRPSGVDPSSQATFSVACLGTDLNNTSSTSPVLDDPLKRKRKVNPSKLSVSGPSQKIARTLDSGTVSTEPFGNADDSSNPSSLNASKTSGPRPHDHFDAFGEYIAAKLRSLDKRSCAFAQKAIGDIIFDAEMGKFMEGAK